MSSSVELLAELFQGYSSAHGTHGEPVQRDSDGKWEIKTTAKTIMQPVTQWMWEQHVNGTRPLGIGPIREDNTCMWGSIDVDNYTTELLSLIVKLDHMKLPLIPCRSKSGGLHLFLFLSAPVPARSVQRTLANLSARLGISGSEVYPKQTQILTERGDLPSWMIMPYFGGTYDGRLQPQEGLRQTGAALTLEEFIRAAMVARITPGDLNEYLPPSAVLLPGDRNYRSRRDASDVSGFSEGPPCVQNITAEGAVGSGGNSLLLMIGIYYKRAHPESWERRLEEANALFCAPQRSTDEIQSMIRSLRKKDYDYTCSTEPMRSYCNVRICRTRKFGIGAWGDFPEIGGLTVLKTDPVIWFVDVDGDRVEILTPDLQNYGRFQAICMEKLQRCYRAMKQDSWLKIVHDAMQSVVPIEATTDSAPGSQFLEIVEQFLTNRRRGKRVEDLLSGRPWEDEASERHMFRLRDLRKFMEHEGIRDIRLGELTRAIEKLGGSSGFTHILGHGTNYWWLPSDAISQEPPVTTPGTKKEEI